MAEPHASGPLCVADLDFAEQFVLWALRTRLEGAGRQSNLEHGSDWPTMPRRAARRSRRSSPGSRCSRRTARETSTSTVPLAHA
jgi:hypothetical protein